MDDDEDTQPPGVDPDNPPLTGKEVWRSGREQILRRIATHKAKYAVSGTGDLFMRNMRIVLTEEGFTGEALENKIKALMQKDVRRLAAVILAPRKSQT